MPRAPLRQTARCLGLILLLCTVSGCLKPAQGPGGPPKEPPQVEVAIPVTRSVVDYEFFTGRTELVRRVDLQARVTGYLDKTFFTEGSTVKEGDLLFLIDQRPYKIELERAEAVLTTSRAMHDLAQIQENRQRELLPTRAGSRDEYDRARTELQTTKGNMLKAEADLKQAKLNYEWTEIRAPFTGRISRWAVDPGNMVKTETILASMGAVEPMYVTFDADERTVLRQLMQTGLKASDDFPTLRLEVGLVDEPGRFPHTAVLNFVDSRLDSNTGSLWMRATFEKPDRLILPGLFSRVRFPLGPPREAICVAEQALQQNQGERFLFVVTGDDTVAERRMVVGRQHGGLREIKSGLKPDDRVVVSGLQRIRDKSKVKPKLVEMPGQKTEAPPDESIPAK